MQNQTPQKTPFYKTWVFWVVILYLLFILLYNLKFYCSEGENILLASNELGDFLAGVFSPLAFLFLILGYKQNSESIKIQNEELKASTGALKNQVEEMQRSVDQQIKQVEIATTQLKIFEEKESLEITRIKNTYRPRFNVAITSTSGTVSNIRVKNIGAPVYQATISYKKQTPSFSTYVPNFDHNQSIEISYNNLEVDSKEPSISISYTDQLDRKETEWFRLCIHSDGSPKLWIVPEAHVSHD